jgi:hypothetical protein
MPASAFGGILLLIASYLLAVGTFLFTGFPANQAIVLGGTYALTAFAAFLFSRGVLEFFVGSDRDLTFFVVLRKLTDPLLALTAPITPGFLMPFAACLYSAFLFFLLKLFLFGDAFLEVPPLFILIYLVVMSAA